MEMDPLAVVLPQFALEEALAENQARHDEESLETDAGTVQKSAESGSLTSGAREHAAEKSRDEAVSESGQTPDRGTIPSLE